MIEAVDKIFQICSSCSLTINEVFDQQVNDFSKGLTQFLKLIYATGQEDSWREFASRLKRYRFLISASPLPLSNCFFETDKTYIRLSELLDLRSRGAGRSDDVTEFAQKVLSSFKALSSSGSNNLNSRFYELLLRGGLSPDSAVVLLDNDLVKAVRDFFDTQKSYKSLEVLSAYELKGVKTFNRIFIFGAPVWFLRKGYAFLFSAPRSPKVDLISYCWINNKIEIKPSFDTPLPSKGTGKKPDALKMAVNTEGIPPQIEIEESDSFLPILDTESLRNRLSKAGAVDEHEEGDDIVEAQIVILAQKKAVLVEHSDTASSFVLNLSGRNLDTDDSGQMVDEEEEEEEEILIDEDDESWQATDQDIKLLGRTPNTELEEGMFLLLRTKGGGDYIVPIADKILGGKKDDCRRMQKNWKSMFKLILERYGPEYTKKELKKMGGTDITETTLRNWIRERNIRPGRCENFEAVMHLLGLNAEIDKYRKNTEIILYAHRRAGGFIRKMLLEQIKKTDLKKLAIDGAMVFNLAGIDTMASMTAYRIEKILSDICQVPFHRLGHPVDIEDDLWR